MKVSAVITLKKGEGRLLKSGGAWIFDNEIAAIEGSFLNGDVVSVRDFDGYPMGKGVINMKVTEKTGAVVGLKVVTPNQELMLITQEGIVIRTNVDEISVISRNTQGVTLMKTDNGDRVASLAVMDQKSE